MLMRLKLIAATGLCGLGLCLLVVPRGHSMLKPLQVKGARRPGRVVFTARADAHPWVVAFADDARTGTQRDAQAAEAFRDRFAATEWSVLDNGQVSITKNGAPLLGARYFANKEQTLFVLHSRAHEMIVDGEILRDDKDRRQGSGRLVVAQLDDDPRRSRTVRIWVALSFEA